VYTRKRFSISQAESWMFVSPWAVGVQEFAESIKASLAALPRPMPAVALFGSLDAGHLRDAGALVGPLGADAEQAGANTHPPRPEDVVSLEP
jgi:hypothetical protein